MTCTRSCGSPRRQRGSAAVELALILPVFVLLLVFAFYFGRVYWHYSVAQRAAHDAARYLATVSQADMLTPVAGGGDAAAVAVARDIVQAETQWLRPGPYPIEVYVDCDGYGCTGHTLPKKVRVALRMYMYDDFFSSYTSGFGGTSGLEVLADVKIPYAGN